MADLQADSIIEALGLVSQKEELNKALMEFDSGKSAIAKFTLKWKELQDHFTDIEKVVNRRVDELKSKEQAFEAKSKKLFEDFAKREEALVQREQASFNSVPQRKVSALSAKHILKANGVNIIDARMAPEEDFSTKISTADAKPQEMAAANGAAAQSMDQNLLHVKIANDGGANNASKDKVSSISVAKVPLSELRVRAELQSLCERMDSDGIKKYLFNQKNDVYTIRTELPSALKLASDPFRLVLRVLDSYPLKEINRLKRLRKDGGAWVIARVCLSLLEALAKVLVDPVTEETHAVVPSDIKASAKKIANKWKSEMDLTANASTGGSINAQAFLQLLATFGLASEFDADELCDLVVILARRRHTLTLCKFLDLSARIPDIVEKLCKENRQVEALSFANAFGILHTLQPAALLKDFVKARSQSVDVMTHGSKAPVMRFMSVMKELSALKAALKCIEEYKLEAQFSSAPLQRRVDQLEKFISDKKRDDDDLKAHKKRPKVSGVESSSVVTDSELLKATEKHHYTSTDLSPYSLSTQNTYNSVLPPASFTAQTGVSDPLSLSSTYLQSCNSLGSWLYGSSDPTVASGRDPVSLLSSYLQSGNALGSQLFGSSDPTHTGDRDLSLSKSYLQSSNALVSQVFESSAYSNPSSTYSSYHFEGSLPTPVPAYRSLFPY